MLILRTKLPNIEVTGMTSRTPIRLTPHRGPLATPSASPESSPALSTPPTDISISHCSTAIRPTLDVAILQHRISTLSPPVRHPSWPRLYRRRRGVAKQGLFDRSTRLSPLGLVFESLVYSAGELSKSLAGVITFCLFIWGLLEWSSHASELCRQPGPQISMSRFPLPSPTRALRYHENPPLCEPSDQHVAVLQFLSEQIQHAKALSSLSVGLGLPLRTFFESYRTAIPRVMVRPNPAELPFAEEVDKLANFTEFIDPSLLDFTSGSFIGSSFTLALEELGDLVSEPTLSHGSSTHGEHQDVHLHAIYWRTASNLLLEYSAARPRVRRLLQHLHTLRQQLSPSVSGHHVARSTEARSNIWWKGAVRHPAASIEDGMGGFVAGLEVTLDNIHRLTAYLDWITEHLAQTSLRDVLKTRHRTGFSSCIMSLQDLFVQSKPSTSTKKLCFCLNDDRVMPLTRPERVEIMVPGGPTVRAKR